MTQLPKEFIFAPEQDAVILIPVVSSDSGREGHIIPVISRGDIKTEVSSGSSNVLAFSSSGNIGVTTLVTREYELAQAVFNQFVVGVDKPTRIPRMYASRNTQEVERFLIAHPNIQNILYEAYPYLVTYFGSTSSYVLEVVRDSYAYPEGKLFAYILTSLSLDEALSRLDDIDNAWFIDQQDRVMDLFNFNIELI